jgi:hypothetical protein
MSSNLKHLLSVCLNRLPIMIVAALVLAPLQSRADTVYSSASAFTAATSGTTTITFNGIAAPGTYVNETSPVTFSGATFTSSSDLFVIDPAYYGFPYTGGGFLSADYLNPDVLTVALPAGTTAVGFDYGGLFGPTGSFLVALSDGFSTTLSSTGSTASGNLDFAGFTSSTDLTSITLTLPDSPGYNALDNFVYGSASPVPEPATLGLMLTGLVGAAGVIRRRIKL